MVSEAPISEAKNVAVSRAQVGWLAYQGRDRYPPESALRALLEHLFSRFPNGVFGS